MQDEPSRSFVETTVEADYQMAPTRELLRYRIGSSVLAPPPHPRKSRYASFSGSHTQG